MNGAGKTSLLSAICWCLTGHVYRAQRPPETIEGAVPLSRIHEETNGTEDTHFYDMSAITPLPSNSVLESLDAGVPVPIDSWVELTFVDDAGNEVGKIRRSVGRSPHGKIQITEPDFSILGLDPIARDVGTKMPGLIPYIQLGTVSDLGTAIAALTGIKSLEDLVRHATKASKRLKNELVKERERDIDNLDAEFVQLKEELQEIITQKAEFDPQKPLPNPGPEKTLEGKLDGLVQHFENLQVRALADAQSILGESFDNTDPEARKDLVNNVGPALGLLDVRSLRRLPSAVRLGQLAGLEPEAQVVHKVVISQPN